MITFTNLTGLASIVILIAVIATLIFRLLRIPQPYLTVLIGVVTVILCIPLAMNGLPPVAYLRGIIGDLSITSVILLTVSLLKYLFDWRFFNEEKRWLLQSVIAITAVVFYPLALGMGYFDPYRLGFGNIYFLITLFVIAIAACYKRYSLLAICIALAVLAWSVGWYESTNLWNYLLDPFVAAYAIGAVIWRCGGMLLKLRRG